MRGLIFGALALLLPTLATAQTIPGADDPRLRAAALAWVNDEDGKANLWRIGTLAAEGNIAARRFMNRVVLNFLYWDYSAAERAELLALLPYEKTRFSRRFFPKVDPDLSEMHLVSVLETTNDPAEFISAGETLLEDGVTDPIRRALHLTYEHRPDVDIEALQWAETWATDDHPLRLNLWFFRYLERNRLELLDSVEPAQARERRTRWGTGPWSPEISSRYKKALSDGRWTAIGAGILEFRDRTTDVEDASLREQLEDWRVLWRESFTAERGVETAPQRFRYVELGEVLLTDAPRTPFLWPLRTACSDNCPAETAHCMGTGALPGLGLPPIVSIEPVVSLEDFYASRRAARHFLYRVGQSMRVIPNQTAHLPKCLRNAADDQFARTDTW